MRPLELVALNIDRPVTIQIKRNERYLGMLVGFDEHLNLYLEDVKSERYVIEENETKSDDEDETRGEQDDHSGDTDEDEHFETVKKITTDMGNLILRGDNVIFMRFDKPNFGRQPPQFQGRDQRTWGLRDASGRPPRRDGPKGPPRDDQRARGPPRRDGGGQRRPEARRERGPPPRRN